MDGAAWLHLLHPLHLEMASSALKDPVKTAYRLQWTLTVDVLHDSTKGRTIENLALDIEEELLGEAGDAVWDAFPAITEVSISQSSIQLQ